MNPLKLTFNGSVQQIVLAIVIGLITMFIGVFMLTMFEPLFVGSLTECSFANTAAAAGAALNATSTSGSTSANITFASATNVLGYCYLTINVTNVSAVSGSYLLVRDAMTLGTIGNLTAPVSSTATYLTTGITHSTGNWLANVTAVGEDNISVTSTGTHITCCPSLVAQSGPAGQIYPNLNVLAGSVFTILGFVLVMIGLAAALSSIKSMTQSS